MSTMLRDYWYIACAASRLGAAPLAIKVLDQELVVFKDASGGAHALLDRCCHRGARLSLGTVTDGALACGYHGWRYDGTGRCMHIPSLPSDRRMPAGVGVRAFPCAAQDSYLWVWMGETPSQPPPPPRIPALERYSWQQGSMTFRCDAMKVIENNVDWCHPPFTHIGTHPFYFGVRDHGFSEYAYEIRTTKRGMVLFAPATTSEDEPIPEHAFAVVRFELPDRVRVEFPAPGPTRLIIVMHFVPTGLNTCRLEWLYTHASEGAAQVAWSAAEPEVFVQDRRILESAQPWYDREGGDFERSVEADASTLLARKIVDLASRGEWETKRSSLPQRRLVRVRA